MEISLKQQALRFIGHQQWLRGRDRSLRTFSHPDHQKSYPFETDFFGRTYSGNMTNFEGLRQVIWRDRPPIFTELQHDRHTGSESQKGVSVRDLLYPNHLVFEVGYSHGQFTLKPFKSGNTEEALVLPAELAGIIRGTGQR